MLLLFKTKLVRIRVCVMCRSESISRATFKANLPTKFTKM